MNTNDKPSKLESIGANTRGAPSGYNLDVSGTVGPDYLGQETVDVDGHPADRPGVRSRTLEERPEDHRIERMDTGAELPVLLESSMRADPIEGTQGSYTEIVEGHCARCGYDRLKVTHHTLAGEHREVCNACGAIQDGRADDGYRMSNTAEERAEMMREAGPTLGSLTSHEVVDLEPETGFGPRVALVDTGGRSVKSFYKDDIADLFAMLVDADGHDTAEMLSDALGDDIQRALVGATILPDGLTIRSDGDGE